MRTLFSAMAAAVCLAAFTSCSSNKVTKADIAAFKLRDLTRFGQPHLVKISPQELQQLEQTEFRSGRMASLDPKFQAPQIPSRAPVDFVPPRLPSGPVLFDGSILPPKQGGSTAVINHHGSLPGQSYGAASYPTAPPQHFSIE